jgi:CRISPR/Cas system-associated endoribonuclease Cas2
MSFLLCYDVTRSRGSLRVKINRELSRIDAKMLQHSMWEHTDFNQLKSVAKMIKSSGGRAIILEKRIVYF